MDWRSARRLLHRLVHSCSTDLRQNVRTQVLVFWSLKSIADPSILVLSTAWHPSRAHVIGTTLSDGRVSLCESSTSGELWSRDAVVHVNNIHHHDLEAWALAFSGESSINVLSGGDDAILQCLSVNEDLQEWTLAWKDRKLHQAGVTAILPLTSDLAVTGSYDDHIRLIAFPGNAPRPQILAEHILGGGVWRLKIVAPAAAAAATSYLPHPENPDLAFKDGSQRFVPPSFFSPEPSTQYSIRWKDYLYS